MFVTFDSNSYICLENKSLKENNQCILAVYNYHFRYHVSFNDSRFLAKAYKPSGWFHVVINFIGPAEGEGIRIYQDGVEVANDTTKSFRTCQDASCRPDGRIVVGRQYTTMDRGYCSLQVDELAFFNEILSQEEITMLSQH